MLQCENKAQAAGVGPSWVNVAEGAVVGLADRRGLHLSRPQLMWIHTANRWYPKKKQQPKKKNSKCLLSGTEAFDQQHILSLGVGLFEDVRVHICINTAGEECVNNATKEFCSFKKRWGGLG